MYGSCHIRSVLIGVEYRNWHQTLDVDLLFPILLGKIYQKLNCRHVTNKLASSLGTNMSISFDWICPIQITKSKWSKIIWQFQNSTPITTFWLWHEPHIWGIQSCSHKFHFLRILSQYILWILIKHSYPQPLHLIKDKIFSSILSRRWKLFLVC